MLDMMPSPHLIFHEWQRHGTCSGLTPQAYFAAIRKARALVKIPAGYLDPPSPMTVSPDAVAEAFVKANPGLTRAAMAVTCDRTRLTEVRLCMTKAFAFHNCANVARRSCKQEKVEVPAVRAARTDKRAVLDSASALSSH